MELAASDSANGTKDRACGFASNRSTALLQQWESLLDTARSSQACNCPGDCLLLTYTVPPTKLLRAQAAIKVEADRVARADEVLDRDREQARAAAQVDLLVPGQLVGGAEVDDVAWAAAVRKRSGVLTEHVPSPRKLAVELGCRKPGRAVPPFTVGQET